MPKTRPAAVHRCSSCGAESAKWVGRCPSCGEWNTLTEAHAAPRVGGPAPAADAVVLAAVPADEATPVPTGVGELDRVLGGGLVPGSSTLLGGAPGVGKSTLLLQVASSAARAGRTVLYVGAEESRGQVRARADRLGALDSGVLVTAETALPHLVDLLTTHDPDLVVVDSIQTVADPAVASAPGTVAQVRACAQALVDEARRRGCALVLLGHVTKEGTLAGPKVLEHLVDTVLEVEGDRHHALRTVRAAKHRHGSTRELGVFEMAADGLRAVPDASRLFLADRRVGSVGSVVAGTLDRHRPLLVEVQALTVCRLSGPVRRETRGVERGRLAVLLAVLERRAALRLGRQEVYVAAAGGARLREPGADLGVALAVASCLVDTPVAPVTVAVGEVGLGGEVRPVVATDRRLDEAARMGFEVAVVPPGAPDHPDLDVIEVADVKAAMAVTGLLSTPVGHRDPVPEEVAALGQITPFTAEDDELLADPGLWARDPVDPHHPEGPWGAE